VAPDAEAGGKSEPVTAGGVLGVTELARGGTLAATCGWLGGACVTGTKAPAADGGLTSPGKGEWVGAAGVDAAGVVALGATGGAATVELELACPLEAATSECPESGEEERGPSMSDSVLRSISSATAAS
jgi:hypothetical protein